MERPPVVLPYGRMFFVVRLFLLAGLFAFLLIFLDLQTTTPSFWVGLIAVVLAVYLFIVGFTPLLTSHKLLRSRLILQQGWYFRCVLPFEEVESIGPWDGEARQGLRISLRRSTLFVVGSSGGLISIRLREPRRFFQVMFLTAREIIFNVDDREAFLAAFEDRKATYKELPATKVLVLPAKQ